MRESALTVLAALGLILVILLVWTMVDGPGVRMTWAEQDAPAIRVISHASTADTVFMSQTTQPAERGDRPPPALDSAFYRVGGIIESGMTVTATNRQPYGAGLYNSGQFHGGQYDRNRIRFDWRYSWLYNPTNPTVYPPPYDFGGTEKHLYFGVPVSSYAEVTAVTDHDGTDIPIQAQADTVEITLFRASAEYRVWVSTGTYTQEYVYGVNRVIDPPQYNDYNQLIRCPEAGNSTQRTCATFTLTLGRIAGAPSATFNRYVVVTQTETPTEADFLSTGARTSATSWVSVPSSSGWVAGRGRVHIALPADQPDPKVIGRIGGPNLRGAFTVGPDVTISGEDFRTLSSSSMVYQGIGSLLVE